MGVVYRARDTKVGRLVALKMLHPEFADDDERRRRFEREARIVSSIDHPGVARVYEFGRDGDTAFLTMELIEGRTLRTLLEGGAFEIDQALDCAIQVAEALDAAHRAGVVHRDLKPENVMLDRDGRYKVLDFGVARFEAAPAAGSLADTRRETVSFATRAGGMVGTVRYMSPEQVLGAPIDARSDLFSFGSLLHELVVGRPAFEAPNELATASAIVSDAPRAARSSRSDLPLGLQLVLDTCLAKRPADRYASAAALLEDLKTLRESNTRGSKTTRRLLAHRRSRAQRWRRLLPAAAVALLLGAAAWVLVSRSVPQRPSTDRPRLAVAWFENRTGDPTADWIERGLPEMLTTDLAAGGAAEVVATQRLRDLWLQAGRREDERPDAATATELARWAGATAVVAGTVYRSGPGYRVDVQVHDTGNGTILFAHKAEGPDLAKLAETTAVALRRGLALDTASIAREVSSMPNEAALRAFAEGTEAFESLRYDQARAAFERAVAADPRFDLARLRLALARHGAGDDAGAAAALAELGAPGSTPLDEIDRLLSRALEASIVSRDLQAVESVTTDLLDRSPDNRIAPVIWAEALERLGGDPVAASARLREALLRDPGNLHAMAGLARSLARLGSPELAGKIAREAARLNPEAEEALLRLVESGSVEPTTVGK